MSKEEEFSQEVLIDRAEMVFAHHKCQIERIEYDSLHDRLNVIFRTPNKTAYTMSVLSENIETYYVLNIVNDNLREAIDYSLIEQDRNL